MIFSMGDGMTLSFIVLKAASLLLGGKSSRRLSVCEANERWYVQNLWRKLTDHTRQRASATVNLIVSFKVLS